MTPNDPNQQDLTRLLAFSDGVFAIAITLLVFQVQIPDLTPQEVATQLPTVLLQMVPDLWAYIQSFFVVGIYWIVHHRIFRMVRRWDEGLLWLNLLFLLVIAFLPVPSALAINYSRIPQAMLVQVGYIGIVALVNIVLWSYLSRGRRLLHADIAAAQIRNTTVRAWIPFLAVVATVLLFLISPWLVYSFPPLIGLGFAIGGRLGLARPPAVAA